MFQIEPFDRDPLTGRQAQQLVQKLTRRGAMGGFAGLMALATAGMTLRNTAGAAPLLLPEDLPEKTLRAALLRAGATEQLARPRS